MLTGRQRLLLACFIVVTSAVLAGREFLLAHPLSEVEGWAFAGRLGAVTLIVGLPMFSFAFLYPERWAFFSEGERDEDRSEG